MTDVMVDRPISVHFFPRRALTLCPQLCVGIQPDARFPARSADALPATLYGHFTQAIYRNRGIEQADAREDQPHLMEGVEPHRLAPAGRVPGPYTSA